MKEDRTTKKAHDLLMAHRSEVIESLGASAFDALTPYEVAQELGIAGSRLPDLIRHGWLDSIPDKDIGMAHQYYRWRVEFVKRYRRTYKKKKEMPAQ